MDIPKARPHYKTEMTFGNLQRNGYSIHVKTDYAGDEQPTELHDQLWTALGLAADTAKGDIARRPGNRTHSGGSAHYTSSDDGLLGHLVTVTITLNDGNTVKLARELTDGMFVNTKSALALALTI